MRPYQQESRALLTLSSGQEYVCVYKFVSSVLLASINPQSSVIRTGNQTLRTINSLS